MLCGSSSKKKGMGDARAKRTLPHVRMFLKGISVAETTGKVLHVGLLPSLSSCTIPKKREEGFFLSMRNVDKYPTIFKVPPPLVHTPPPP